MNDIIQAVLNDDYVGFNEKFKDKLQTKYDVNVEKIAVGAKQAVFELAMVDGDKICPSCGKFLPIALQGPGSCIYCGNLI